MAQRSPQGEPGESLPETAPANVGLVETDVDARVTLPREPTRLARAKVALKLSAGFGGINAAVVFAR